MFAVFPYWAQQSTFIKLQNTFPKVRLIDTFINSSGYNEMSDCWNSSKTFQLHELERIFEAFYGCGMEGSSPSKLHGKYELLSVHVVVTMSYLWRTAKFTIKVRISILYYRNTLFRRCSLLLCFLIAQNPFCISYSKNCIILRYRYNICINT